MIYLRDSAKSARAPVLTALRDGVTPPPRGTGLSRAARGSPALMSPSAPAQPAAPLLRAKLLLERLIMLAYLFDLAHEIGHAARMLGALRRGAHRVCLRCSPLGRAHRLRHLAFQVAP